MRERRILSCVYIALFSLALGFPMNTALASVPSIINFQGFLTDSNDVAVPNGSYDITFSIWDGDDDGTSNKLWEETHTTVQVTGGVYSISLGSITSFSDPDGNENPSDTLTFAIPYYLGVRVDSDAIMTVDGKLPALTSVGSAFRSGTSAGWLITSKNENYTLTDNDDILLASGDVTITLPSATFTPGRTHTVKKTDSEGTKVSVLTTSGQTIDGVNHDTSSGGAALILEEPYQDIMVISDGANWLRLGHTESVTVDTDHIATGAVTTDNLASNAVTSGKIADDTITDVDISAVAAISDTKLATISTAGKVADSALSGNVTLLGLTIESSDISDGTITNADISETAAISDIKLATISWPGKVADTALSSKVSLFGE